MGLFLALLFLLIFEAQLISAKLAINAKMPADYAARKSREIGQKALAIVRENEGLLYRHLRDLRDSAEKFKCANDSTILESLGIKDAGPNKKYNRHKIPGKL